MKDNALVVTNYDKVTQKDLLKTSKKMLGTMPLAPAFAACAEKLKEYANAFSKFEQLDIAAQNRGTHEWAVRRNFINEQLRPQINEIAAIAAPIIGDNYGLAVQSGLLLRHHQSEHRSTILTHLKEGTVVYNTADNTIAFSCIKLESARGYECIARLYDGKDWGIKCFSVTPQIILRDLSMGSRLICKLRTLNSKNEPTEWSDEFLL